MLVTGEDEETLLGVYLLLDDFVDTTVVNSCDSLNSDVDSVYLVRLEEDVDGVGEVLDGVGDGIEVVNT